MKKDKHKILLALVLIFAIALSSTACNKEAKQNTLETSEGIIKENTVATKPSENNEVKSNATKDSEVTIPEDKTSEQSKSSPKTGSDTKSSSGTVTPPTESQKVPSQKPNVDSEQAPEPEANVDPEQKTDSTLDPEQTTNPTPSTPSEQTPPERTGRTDGPGEDDIVSYASNFIGVRYLWGGTSPVDTNPDPNIDNSGFDDGGFVQYVFAHFDIAVGRTSRDQIKVGDLVPKEELRKGDIVFFGNTVNTPVHVGIYAGNNIYIHAAKTGEAVKFSPFDRTDFIAARRVIK